MNKEVTSLNIERKEEKEIRSPWLKLLHVVSVASALNFTELTLFPSFLPFHPITLNNFSKIFDHILEVTCLS